MGAGNAGSILGSGGGLVALIVEWSRAIGQMPAKRNHESRYERNIFSFSGSRGTFGCFIPEARQRRKPRSQACNLPVLLLYLSDEDVYEEYRQADLLCMPMLDSAANDVLLEAWPAGRL